MVRRYGAKLPGNFARKIAWLNKRHGANSAKYLVEGADVFIGWTGSSLEALIVAREQVFTTILERGSSHCNEWRLLMSEEMQKLGKSFDPMYDIWQRELLEYELADYISIPSNFVKNSFIKHGVPEKN